MSRQKWVIRGHELYDIVMSDLDHYQRLSIHRVEWLLSANSGHLPMCIGWRTKIIFAPIRGDQ